MACYPPAKQRLNEALELLGNGYGTGEAVALLADRWGCSRRTARRSVSAANEELVATVSDIDRQQMLAGLIVRLEVIARLAVEREQYAAAVGAIKQLHAVAVQGSVPRRVGSFRRLEL